MVELTDSEASSILDLLDFGFIEYIKSSDADSMLWLDNIMSVWRKCGGRKQFSDGDE